MVEWIISDSRPDRDGNSGIEYAIIDNGVTIPLVTEYPTGAIYVYLADETYLSWINVLLPGVTLDTFTRLDDTLSLYTWIQV